MIAFGGTGHDTLTGCNDYDGLHGGDRSGNLYGTTDVLDGSHAFEDLYWNDGVFYVNGGPGDDVISIAQMGHHRKTVCNCTGQPPEWWCVRFVDV